jgi:hypothetical protein
MERIGAVPARWRQGQQLLMELLLTRANLLVAQETTSFQELLVPVVEVPPFGEVFTFSEQAAVELAK